MKKYISVLLSILMILSLFTACGKTEPAATEPVKSTLTYAGKTVTFIGDSITYGIGLENQTNQYWLHLQKNMELGNVQNKGVSGSCVSTQGTRGLERQPLAIRVNSFYSTDIFLIFMGTNDFGCDVPIGTMEDQQDVSFMGAWNFAINTFKKRHPDTKIVLMTPLPRYSKKINALDLKLDAYVDAIRQIAQTHDLPLIDLYTMMADEFTEENCEKYMPDKLHPNEAGHELMAQRIQAWLEENIETVLG